MGLSFAEFTDADWWQFWIGAVTALGTLAAVIVAVWETVAANRRSKQAELKAAYAESGERAAVSVAKAQASSASEATRLGLEADLKKQVYWRRVAADYRDDLRLLAIDAEITRLTAELETLSRSDSSDEL